ncbi:hypothetical protein DERF_001809, partial [Dermatophagoides farinae]
MDKLANNDKRYIREKLTKISEQIICKKPRAQIIAAYSRLIKRMWGIAEKNETICFEYCLDIDFWERINNHMILISQSDLPEFHLMKLKQDLERANRLKTNSKSQRMDQFQSPIIHFPHIKKIVREILNEIETFLEVKNFETNDGLIFAIGDTWKIDHKSDYHAVEKIIFWHEIDSDKFLNKNPSPTEISQTSSLSVVVNNLSISYKNYQKCIKKILGANPSPYEENEQIEMAIKASLQDHKITMTMLMIAKIENESMMEQHQSEQTIIGEII